MPLYEYICADCGKVVELLVSGFSKREPEERCAECGGKLKRIFSTIAGGAKSCESCGSTSCATSG